MKYICSVCGYIYDEQKEGTLFSALPESWVCPLCKAPKSAFTAQSAAPAKKKAVSEDVQMTDELKELSAGELAAVFSNLARGCEKQYHQEEADLFTEIADYFTQIAPAPDACKMQDLADLIRHNFEDEYPALEAAAEKHHDRGMLRAYTWGTKVTRMQQAVVDQYLQKGESFLQHTNVWICTVCGFIYIGENPPAQCPVCKVPDWKFEKVEGGKLA